MAYPARHVKGFSSGSGARLGEIRQKSFGKPTRRSTAGYQAATRHQLLKRQPEYLLALIAVRIVRQRHGTPTPVSFAQRDRLYCGANVWLFKTVAPL
jgi:hypothetical protein